MFLASILATSSKTVRGIGRKLERSLKRRGVAGTLKFFALNIPSIVRDLAPSRRQAKSAQSEYYRKFNVNTSGEIHLSDLDIASPNSAFGNSYEPSPPKIINEMIAALDIRYQDFTFIDIGSGKGLVLLIASTYPFRKIIGVEFSPELNRVAKENIRNYQNSEQQCNDIQLVLRDVTEYVWPSDPLVLYMFNPFNEKIVQTLVTRIRESLEAHPRPLFILYKNPVANRVFEEGNFLKTVRFSKAYAIYKFKGSGV